MPTAIFEGPNNEQSSQRPQDRSLFSGSFLSVTLVPEEHPSPSSERNTSLHVEAALGSPQTIPQARRRWIISRLYSDSPGIKQWSDSLWGNMAIILHGVYKLVNRTALNKAFRGVSQKRYSTSSRDVLHVASAVVAEGLTRREAGPACAASVEAEAQ